MIFVLQYWNVVAYATAEEYNLEKMTKGLLDQNLYTPIKQPKPLDRNQSGKIRDITIFLEKH